MDLNFSVMMCLADSRTLREDKLEALQAENLYLRQLVGELLLKNQSLRQAGLVETSGRLDASRDRLVQS